MNCFVFVPVLSGDRLPHWGAFWYNTVLVNMVSSFALTLVGHSRNLTGIHWDCIIVSNYRVWLLLRELAAPFVWNLELLLISSIFILSAIFTILRLSVDQMWLSAVDLWYLILGSIMVVFSLFFFNHLPLILCLGSANLIHLSGWIIKAVKFKWLIKQQVQAKPDRTTKRENSAFQILFVTLGTWGWCEYIRNLTLHKFIISQFCNLQKTAEKCFWLRLSSLLGKSSSRCS